MPLYTQTEIEQLIRHAQANLPEKTRSLLEAQCQRGALTNVQIAQLNNQVNHLQQDAFVCYVAYGIINTDVLKMLTRISPERRELALAILQGRTAQNKTPRDINDTIAKCHTECIANHTDVIFMGMPSSGVTSVIMGLIGSPNIYINTVRASGAYAIALNKLLDAGEHYGQTPRDFTATVEAQVTGTSGDLLANIIEMPCEDIATKIANGQHDVVASDLSVDAPRIFSDANRKKLFIVIDISREEACFNSIVTEADTFGSIRTYRIPHTASQKEFMSRVVSLLSKLLATQALQRVEAINIIASKADLLGNGKQREEQAFQRFSDTHQDIIDPLIELCQRYGINRNAGGQPMLYTYSLGRHDSSGHYHYDPADANKIIEAIKELRVEH